ncbi:glycoside hydrolase family 18 protein [Sabulilitoribacter arenilitoris]|uniref:chitinase n=1 Tax=Wocania arenilitoris TaxID=2044858 RepID=A0AAE3EM14_9FLAO|nr:glycoside hydrolase family 18 protein [Wocania arenilitoris]MCF7567838.1 glycoside hydrolase family 18 protein [Wocania arenilitoris]
MKSICKSKQLIVPLILMLLFLGCSKSVEKKEDPVKVLVEDLKIIGYVAGYEDYDPFDPSSVDANKLTHINYAFANIVEGKPKFELELDSIKIPKVIALKKKNPNLKVLYSIGGWVWSDKFSHTAAYPDARKKFAKGCVKLMKKHGFDGVDLDWEYPGQRAEDNAIRSSDKENFTMLLAEIRKQLDAAAKTDNTHYLLTIATGANQAYIDNTDLGKAHQYLDFINIMCYDYYHGWYYQTGHHANLYPSDKERFTGNSGQEAITRHIKAGVPANKLIMGIPFYGRMWEKVSIGNGGLYENAMSPGMIIPYWDIIEKLKSGSYKKEYDETAKASYLWNAADSIFISWETPKDIELKAKYIKQNGLGGAMFWEYSLDKNQELLNTLYKTIK